MLKLCTIAIQCGVIHNPAVRSTGVSFGRGEAIQRCPACRSMKPSRPNSLKLVP